MPRLRDCFLALFSMSGAFAFVGWWILKGVLRSENYTQDMVILPGLFFAISLVLFAPIAMFAITLSCIRLMDGGDRHETRYRV